MEQTFKIEDQGELSDYLGIKIERKADGTLEWTQPTLTQSILKDLKLDGEEIKGKISFSPLWFLIQKLDHNSGLHAKNQKEISSNKVRRLLLPLGRGEMWERGRKWYKERGK